MSVPDLEPGHGSADDGEAPSNLHARLSRLEGAVAELGELWQIVDESKARLDRLRAERREVLVRGGLPDA